MSAPILPHVTPELARRAAKHFQCLYAEPQSEDDGHEMATNSLGAFGVLMDWQRRADGAPAGEVPVPPAPRRNQRRRARPQPSPE